MDNVRDVQKKYCSQAMMVAILLSFLFVIMGEKPLGKGLLLGTLFSIINFVIMGQLITLNLAKSRSKGSLLALFSIFFRYLILAIPLIISLKIDSVEFATVAIGLFMVQLTILFNHIILKRDSLSQKTEEG